MPEKSTNSANNADQVSQYIVDRLRRKGTTEQDAGQAKHELTPEELDSKVLDLSDLTQEKQDLLEVIGSSERLAAVKPGKRPEHISQDEIMAALDNIENVESAQLRRLSNQLESDQSIASAAQEAKTRLREIEKKISGLVADDRVADAYQIYLKEKIGVIHEARKVESLRALMESIDLAETKLLTHRHQEDIKLTKADREVLKRNRTIQAKAQEKIDELMLRPETYYEVKRRELLEYRRQLLRDGFVETPSLKKEVVNPVLAHLELGIPVLLRGHLGAGKTEILLHTARKYYGVEPEFISGSEEATKYDIYGKTQIGARAEEDRIKEYKTRVNEFKSMFPEAGEQELKQIEKQYYDTIVVRGQTTSFFQHGPLVRAMQAGSPPLIDEIDGIPHSILMRLNHVLTRRAGDKVKIQENGGEEIEVAGGFCPMATANIKSARYKREDLDPAFLSRWWSTEIKYLPEDETLKILTASLIDKRGQLELKEPGDFEDLQRLVQAAKEIQDIFTGDKTDVYGEGGDVVRGISASLEKSVLSMRDLWNIVKPWKAGNFKKPLDYYIHTEFINKATVPKDAVYLTQLFCRFGFFKDWTPQQFGIAGLDQKKLDAFRVKENN